jgi:hypothetical protein
MLRKRESRLAKDSIVNVSQLLTLSKDFLMRRVGRIPPARVREVEGDCGWCCHCSGHRRLAAHLRESILLNAHSVPTDCRDYPAQKPAEAMDKRRIGFYNRALADF